MTYCNNCKEILLEGKVDYCSAECLALANEQKVTLTNFGEKKDEK